MALMSQHERRSRPARPGSSSPGALRLASAWLALLALAATAIDGPTVAKAADVERAPVLTNVLQVVSLDPELARPGKVEARLKGVLTYFVGRRMPWYFLQDETGGVLVTTDSEMPFPIASGQLVELEGTLAAGVWLPYVQQRQVRLLGTAPMPAPRHTLVSQLAQGADFGVWNEVDATVRDVAITKGRLVLLCATAARGIASRSLEPRSVSRPSLRSLTMRNAVSSAPRRHLNRERRPLPSFYLRSAMPSW